MKNSFYLSTLGATILLKTFLCGEIAWATQQNSQGYFFVEANAGAMSPLHLKPSFQLDIPPSEAPQTPWNPSYALSHFSGGLQVGGDYRVPQTPLTLGLTAGYQFLQAKFQKMAPVFFQAQYANDNNAYCKFQDLGYFSLATRIGLSFGRFLTFGKIGLATHALKISGGKDEVEVFFRPKKKTVFLLGLGADVRVHPSWTVGAVMHVHFFPHLSFPFKNVTPPSLLADIQDRIFADLKSSRSWEFLATVKWTLP